MKKICVIGLGFVGLTMALTLAKKGFKVCGIEKEESILKNLKKRKSHFFEPGINKLIANQIKKKNFYFSKKVPEENFDTYIITVGTPLNSKFKINIDYIRKTIEQVSQKLKNGNLVILRSTVAVGTTRKVVLPILKKSKKLFYLSFCPERTLEGKALKELLYLPQIIGGIDNKSCELSKKLFNKITPDVFVTSSLETAEMIKLVDNANRDVFFSYANEIAYLCNGYGISASEVITIGKKKYPRTNLPMPGLVGGPCLEKDPHILVQSSIKDNKVIPKLTQEARNINENMPEQVVKYLKKFIQRKKINFNKKKLNILVCGLAFKGSPPTSDIRGSMAYRIIYFLKKNFIKSKISGYDPMVSVKDKTTFKIAQIKNLKKGINNSDIVLFLTNLKEFSLIKLDKLKSNKKPKIIYDFWSNISNKSHEFKKQNFYICLGNHIKFK